LSKTDFNTLMQAIFENGCYSKAGRNAIAELVAGGGRAIDMFLSANCDLPETTLHPRDVADTISDVFGQFAKRDANCVIDRCDQIGEIQTYWSLGLATGQRSIDVLIDGLTSRDKYARWAAAESLIRRRSKWAVPALAAALKDRSSLVKSAIVQAMKSNRIFRCAEALPALRRIIASKSMQKHSPGTWKTAKEVVKMIEAEAS
jgi:hypothetical protein